MRLGICGDNCDECPRGIATRTGDAKLLAETLALWIKSGLRSQGTPVESLLCFGCASVAHCAYYTQRECARARNVDNCGLCADYPCAIAKESFRRSDATAEMCKKRCTGEEFAKLEKAFFSKKKYLDEVSKMR